MTGGFYRHFKNKLYQVKGIAYHSETKEKMVVYQAMYGDYSLYVRPYDMFLSEVDHVKYPEMIQKYRFEETTPEDFIRLQNKAEDMSDRIADTTKSYAESSETAEEEQPDKLLMDFLDIDTYQGKLKYIDELKDSIDDKIIDAMAVSLDAEISQGTPDSRIESLRRVIAAHAKYESTRLR